VLGDPSLGQLLVLADTAGPRWLKEREIHLASIFTAVEASSAYPIAFGPRTIRYFKSADLLNCAMPKDGPWSCTAPSVEAQFADGGVFDNNPLGLAYGLHRCLSAYSRDHRPTDREPICRDTTNVTILYIDPDARRDSAGGLLPLRLDTGHVDGLSAVTGLLWNAVRSAREYELAVFHRSRQLFKQLPPGADSIDVVPTDRFHAIVGDHFNAFGAFLGRPFREFDFYVGVYDAARFAATRWFCGDRAAERRIVRQGEQRDPGVRACEQRVLEAVACGSLFRLDRVARHLLARLYFEEHNARPNCALPDLDSTARRRVVVLEAVSRANAQIRQTLDSAAQMPDSRAKANAGNANGGPSKDRKKKKEKPDPFRCGKREFLEEVLCSNGFSLLLDTLRTKRVKPAVEALANTAPCRKGVWDRRETTLDVCRIDATVLSLVNDPVSGADALFIDIQRRLSKVESGKGKERVVDFGEFLYHTGREANLRGPRTGSSIPTYEWRWPKRGRETAGAASHLLPFHLSSAVGTEYYVIGYRPTIYGYKRVALILPLEWSATQHHVQGTTDVRHEWRFRNSVGAGLAYVHASKWFSGVDATAFMSDAVWRWPGRNKRNVGGELAGRFLGNKLRLGVRVLPEAERGPDAVVLAGLSDFGGLVYWALRIAG
jgi:hypothetical protein